MLERLADLDMLEILQTKIVDRILKDIWSSKIDISGHIMDNSSCFTILRYGNLSYNEDFEYRYRFYSDGRLANQNQSKARPHLFTFRVWCESIKLRYFIEMIVYFTMLMTFQYFVSKYNDDLHRLTDEIKQMHLMDDLLTQLRNRVVRVLAETVVHGGSETTTESSTETTETDEDIQSEI